MSVTLLYLKYFNEATECNFWEVIPNDIKKEIENLDSSKEVTFKNITPNLPKNHKIYVVHYHVIYGPKKLYEKGFFEKVLKPQM